MSERYKKIKELCDDYFINVMIQPYAGATRECQFCGAMEKKSGNDVAHSTDCPVLKYKEILAGEMR